LSIQTELAEAGTVSRLLSMAADRVVVTVRPRLVQDGNRWRFVYPGLEEEP
jgi:hypothetical protein